ncbi:ribonuclease MRP protein subunit POP4 isoform X3 [Malania oleifera]|uniref:ribonuclease MRP protein subunit POP4 isoform X3 n=1 Tax=Malania oleifera TaxID=397392 RepID=UPI0025AE1D3D|nr:ribonuclease MRP protein subunit POP4 isoform X3 [Malania oleifera]XP_057984108.1 ribonuclease MRP protein subunit POP4 isoform X3 [Malania oleifera]
MAAEPVVQDQRKHTLEALERRFAVAKAELTQQQHKNKRQFREDQRDIHSIGSSSTGPSLHLTDASISPSPTASSKKGNFSFSGYTTLQDAEATGPAYSQLSHPVHENLLTENVKMSSRTGSTVNNILHEMLQKGDSAQKYMQGSKSLKIDNWILLDNFIQGRGASYAACTKVLQNQSKRSKKHLSISQHKKLGSFDLPQELHKFDFFKPMHEMWKDYMMQLLRNTGKNQLAQCLLNADLHGAIILVVECKISAFTGARGIMIRETAETFGIISQDNKFRGRSPSRKC